MTRIAPVISLFFQYIRSALPGISCTYVDRGIHAGDETFLKQWDKTEKRSHHARVKLAASVSVVLRLKRLTPKFGKENTWGRETTLNGLQVASFRLCRQKSL